MSVVLSKLMTYIFLKLCLKKILLALIYLMKLHLDYKHWNTFWAHFIIWRFPFEIQICNDVRSMQFSFSFSLYIKMINGHRYKMAQFTHSKAFKFWKPHWKKSKYLPFCKHLSIFIIEFSSSFCSIYSLKSTKKRNRIHEIVLPTYIKYNAWTVRVVF